MQTWYEGRLMHETYIHGRIDDLGLDARSQCLGRGKPTALSYLDNKASSKD